MLAKRRHSTEMSRTASRNRSPTGQPACHKGISPTARSCQQESRPEAHDHENLHPHACCFDGYCRDDSDCFRSRRGTCETATIRIPPRHGLAPVAIAAAADGKTLYIACTACVTVMVLDQASAAVVRRVELPGSPSGLALSHDGTRLLVTCASAASRICEIETAAGTDLGTLPAGHFAGSPVLTPDGKTLCVCNRFDRQREPG